MSNWIIKLTYKDGKEMNVVLPKEEVNKFLDAYKNKKDYWAPESVDGGFMTKFDEARAIVWGKEPPPKEVKTAENK